MLSCLPAQRAHFLELGVIRTFDFVSALRRMSVIVKRLKSTSMEVYVKGAPEVMNDICVKDSCKPFQSSKAGSFGDMITCWWRQFRRTMMICSHITPNGDTVSLLSPARV